ncbi:hypothetical protein GCM10017764_32450 [Sphingobacterium griseoflavum]|uniref:Transposase n=1 Tax=Sphingobacterium griseoflavum TaxID=1474952 RepID=A0ABQ3I3G6_9SPHI|nr:hypothetical protein GCM10017764_32450 [Sphingobacterium griseoflavum]
MQGLSLWKSRKRNSKINDKIMIKKGQGRSGSDACPIMSSLIVDHKERYHENEIFYNSLLHCRAMDKWM